MNRQQLKELTRTILGKIEPLQLELMESRSNTLSGGKTWNIRVKPKQHQTLSSLRRLCEGVYDLLSEEYECTFHRLSPHSSKYSGITFDLDQYEISIVIAHGGNKGEKFEDIFLEHIQSNHHSIHSLLDSFGISHSEIVNVRKRTGSTKRFGLPLEQHGAVVADVIIDTHYDPINISLKEENGSTIFNMKKSKCATSDFEIVDDDVRSILSSFHVDFDRLKDSFLAYQSHHVDRYVSNNNGIDVSDLIHQCWGSNYWYVRRTKSGFKTFEVNTDFLYSSTDDLAIDRIAYPGFESKQLRIDFSNKYFQYNLQFRNSSGGIVPDGLKVGVEIETDFECNRN